MSTPKYTLESLTAKTEEVSVGKAEENKKEYVNHYGTNIWLWLVVIFVIVLVVLWFLSPKFIFTEDECEHRFVLDWGKLVIWSIVISLVIVLLIWLFRPYYNCEGSKGKE